MKRTLLTLAAVIFQSLFTVALYRGGLISYLFPLPIIAGATAYFLIYKNSLPKKFIIVVVLASMVFAILCFFFAMLYCLNVYGS